MNDTAPSGPQASLPVVRAHNLSKRFGATQALSAVSLDIHPGEVRALVGRNGAGKSTLVSLLTGLLTPDAGEITFLGAPAPDTSKPDQWLSRVACVYQHPKIFPTLSCAENLFLSENMRRRKRISWSEMRRNARAILDHWDLGFDIDAPAGTLDVGQRQLLEISRALIQGSHFVILDEPTAKLNGKEVDRLFTHIETLRSNGVGVLYISHHLDEIFEICRTVTVLRDGHKVLDCPIPGLSRAELIQAMVGTADHPSASDRRAQSDTPGSDPRAAGESHSLSVSNSPPISVAACVPQTTPESCSTEQRRSRDSKHATRRTLLEVHNLTCHGEFESLNFQIHSGEWLGLAGLAGSGKEAVGEVLAGLRPFHTGTILLGGHALSGADVHRHNRSGIGFVPQDRHREGLVSGLSVAENATLAITDELGPLGLINPAAQDRITQKLIAELDIKTPDPQQPVSSLSGGNQQRVVFARALARNPRVLVLINPTSGVDIASKAALFATLHERARRGVGILIISDELEELEMCERVLVIHSHRLHGEFLPPFASHDLVAAMEGIH